MSDSAKAIRALSLLFAACAAASAGLIAREGWEPQTYPDPVHGWKVPTACAGLTEGIQRGRTYTEAECLSMTGQAMFKHAAPIIACVRDDFPNSQKGRDFLGEMVSMSHNIGTSGFLGSAMCSQMKAGNYKAACDAILRWKYAGGIDCSGPNQRVCPGLWADRLRQHEACLRAAPAQSTADDGAGLKPRQGVST